MGSEGHGRTVLTKTAESKSARFPLLQFSLVFALGVGIRAWVVLSRPKPGEIPESLGFSVFQYIAAFFPYILALLLTMASNRRGKSVASGISLVASGLYLLGCLIVLLPIGIFYLGGYPLLWVFISSHVLVAVASRPVLKSPADLGIGAGIVAGYIAIAMLISRIEDMKQLKAERAAGVVAASKASEGVDAIKDLAWCAIQYRTASGGGYPADVQILESFTKCSRGKVTVELPDYLVSYDPVSDANGKVTRFEASVVPRDSQSGTLNSYFGDESGVVLKQPPGSYKDILPLADNPFSVLRYLIWHLKMFANGRPQLGYPANLRDLPQSWLTNMLHRAAAPRGNSFLTQNGDYQFIYRAAAVSRPAGSFELEARCEHYAKSCVRNYLVTDTGEVHATSEDRPARLDDPPATKIEMRGGLECALPCESVQP